MALSKFLPFVLIVGVAGAVSVGCGDDVTLPDNMCVLVGEDGNQVVHCGDLVIPLPQEGCPDGFNGSVHLYGNIDDPLLQAADCTRIRGNVLIQDYAYETLPAWLAKIEQIDGTLQFYNNQKLKDFEFPALKRVGLEITGFNNNQLTNFGDFPVLVEVGGISWLHNENATSPGSFPILESVRNGISYSQNKRLETTPAFPMLTEAGFIDVDGNIELASIGAFAALKTVIGDIAVRNNRVLETVGEFPKLQSVESLIITHGFTTPVLSELGGFSSLTTVRGDLHVVGTLLSSLDALPKVEKVGGNLAIYQNPALSQCELDDFVDRIMSAGGIGGDIEAHGGFTCGP